MNNYDGTLLNTYLDKLPSIDILRSPPIHGSQLESEWDQFKADGGPLDEMNARLRARHNEIVKLSFEASKDPGPMHPSHDTYSDDMWFHKTFASQGGIGVSDSLGETDEDIAILARNIAAHLTGGSDPTSAICGGIVDEIHRFMKHKLSINGAKDFAARPDTPTLGGTSVGVLLWEARNQNQHYIDDKNLHGPCVDAFTEMIHADPELFGWDSTHQDLQNTSHVQNHLKSRSFAREVLVYLNLTNRIDILSMLRRL